MNDKTVCEEEITSMCLVFLHVRYKSKQNQKIFSNV